MSAELAIRDATQSDAADLAILDDLAGHGLPSWLWYGAVSEGRAQSAFERGRERMLDPEAPYGWKNARLAMIDGIVAGGATGYLMPETIPDDKAVSPDPVLQPVFELFGLTSGHWLLDALAVYSAFRGKGVGRALLEDAFVRARATRAEKISLVAENDNVPAVSLYRSLGFKPVGKRAYVPFHQRSKTQFWLLLTAAV